MDSIPVTLRGAEQELEAGPNERPGRVAATAERLIRREVREPPDKEEVGITWKSHVPSQSPLDRPTALNVIALASEGDQEIPARANHVLFVPRVPELFAPAVVTPPLQLLAITSPNSATAMSTRPGTSPRA